MFLAATPQAILANLSGITALVVVLVAGILAVSMMARHRVIGLLVVVASAALVYLAVKGTLIVDVSGWLTGLGL